MGRLANKNILITGGNSRIGLAAAQEFELTACAKTIEDWRSAPDGVNKESGNAYSVQSRTISTNRHQRRKARS